MMKKLMVYIFSFNLFALISYPIMAEDCCVQGACSDNECEFTFNAGPNTKTLCLKEKAAGGLCNAEEKSPVKIFVCQPSATPLMMIDIMDASLSLTGELSGFNYEVNLRSVDPADPYKYRGLTIFGSIQALSPNAYRDYWNNNGRATQDEHLFIQPSTDEISPIANAGDSITITYEADGVPGQVITAYFPELTGVDAFVNLYTADDGSTYYDPAMTQLAASACDYQ
jgi:hypothetical protein